jgi:serine/threonine protein kinase
MSLFIDGEILHRDISIGNVLINRTDPQRMVGFVGDLDNAKFVLNMETLSLEERNKVIHRTGTRPFLAIGILLGESHTYRHDLESFFYVFLWVCIVYKEPNKECEKMPKEIKYWLEEDFEHMALSKKGQMDAKGFERITELFSSYFQKYQVLKEVSWELRELLFGTREDALFYSTHGGDRIKIWYEKFMEVLDNASKKV